MSELDYNEGMKDEVKKHFQVADPVLYAVMGKLPDITISASTDYFTSLCEAIVSQQLSEKAGATIWNRFVGLFPKGHVTPERVLALPDEKIRAVGPSWSKISYIKNIARAVLETALPFDMFPSLSNEEIIIHLTKIKGIGPWTAEMFLMFTLGREDVFSYGDLGLRHGIQKLYKFKDEPTRKQMEKIVKKWSPYRTYAARILWKILEIDL